MMWKSDLWEQLRGRIHCVWLLEIWPTNLAAFSAYLPELSKAGAKQYDFNKDNAYLPKRQGQKSEKETRNGYSVPLGFVFSFCSWTHRFHLFVLPCPWTDLAPREDTESVNQNSLDPEFSLAFALTCFCICLTLRHLEFFQGGRDRRRKKKRYLDTEGKSVMVSWPDRAEHENFTIWSQTSIPCWSDDNSSLHY